MECMTKILSELLGYANSLDPTLLNKEILLKAFVNIISSEGYTKNTVLYAVRGISSICTKKGGREIINMLLRIPGNKFLDGFYGILSEKDVLFIGNKQKI